MYTYLASWLSFSCSTIPSKSPLYAPRPFFLVFYPKFSSLLCIFSLDYLICAQGFHHQMLTHARINFPNPNSLLRHELVYTTAWCTSLFDCFTATNLNVDKSHIHAPPPRSAPFLLLLCEFHHPLFSPYIVKKH